MKGPTDCAEYMLLQARRQTKVSGTVSLGEEWTNIYAAQLPQFVGYGCEVRALTRSEIEPMPDEVEQQPDESEEIRKLRMDNARLRDELFAKQKLIDDIKTNLVEQYHNARDRLEELQKAEKITTGPLSHTAHRIVAWQAGKLSGLGDAREAIGFLLGGA